MDTWTAPVAATSAVLVAAGWRWVLPLIAEPADRDDKTPYASLATLRHAVAVGAAAGAGAVVGTTAGPAWPLWVVLAVVALPLAVIDGCTTWLPAVPTRVGWALMVVAAVVAGLLPGGGWDLTGRAAAGAAAAAVLYGGVWLATRGGFGFGDVRYAPLLGAAAAGVSWTVLAVALLAGSILALAHGVGRLVRRRPGLYPWAPGLLAGCYLALPLTRL